MRAGGPGLINVIMYLWIRGTLLIRRRVPMTKCLQFSILDIRNLIITKSEHVRARALQIARPFPLLALPSFPRLLEPIALPCILSLSLSLSLFLCRALRNCALESDLCRTLHRNLLSDTPSQVSTQFSHLLAQYHFEKKNHTRMRTRRHLSNTVKTFFRANVCGLGFRL